ncbi:transglutaminase-like superfamily protein [Oxobacter pfennigii]|uniref:Transglutaminase-like superfamily protein n=1 Tax=Oxobacter pfennigii TaxID=36849 RepID=A0A0N8NT99_9CLOT|nr:transglutaminase-like domain-containing protein [Oxobacter pfennigii]KPU44240.1 transglutaminase-like superfamily protein [Oxobacter pfennigii]
MIPDLNLLTLLVIVLFMIFLLKGLKRNFTVSDILYSITGKIDTALFIGSLLLSVYLTKKVLFDEVKEGIFEKVYRLIPSNIMNYIIDAGILVFLVITPLILLLIFSVLVYTRSYFDKLLFTLSEFMAKRIEAIGKTSVKVLGVTLELIKGTAAVICAVFIIGQVFIFFPGTGLESYAKSSRAYNFIDGYIVSPVLRSSLGSKVPVYLKASISAISTDIIENKVLGNSASLETLSYIRFQYETRSNDEINEKAKELVGDETDQRKKARILYEWIGSNINYDWDKYKNIINGDSDKDKFGAIETFNTRKGVCEDYSDLYVAMARAVDLKVRIVVGQGYSMDSWAGHAWNEVYIGEEEKWIPIDATWANSGDYFDSSNFYDDHIIEAVAGEWQ